MCRLQVCTTTPGLGHAGHTTGASCVLEKVLCQWASPHLSQPLVFIGSLHPTWEHRFILFQRERRPELLPQFYQKTIKQTEQGFSPLPNAAAFSTDPQSVVTRKTFFIFSRLRLRRKSIENGYYHVFKTLCRWLLFKYRTDKSVFKWDVHKMVSGWVHLLSWSYMNICPLTCILNQVFWGKWLHFGVSVTPFLI